MELKQNVAIKVPVRLRAVVDGSPLSGVTYSQISVFLQKNGGASATKGIGPSDWTEVDATNMPGEYDLSLAGVDVDTIGFLRYYVAYPGVAVTYSGLMQVVANIESDTYTRLGTPVGASISADIAASLSTLSTSIATLSTDVAAVGANVSRILGLVFDNIVEDNQVYDASAHLTGARIRCYDTKAHAQAAGVIGLLYQYTVTATYDTNGNAILFQVVREQ